MNRLFSLFLITLTALFIFVSRASAQTDSLWAAKDMLPADRIISHKQTEDAEVISASRTGKKIKDLPVTIHVITREEIIRNGYITLADVLKTLPGIRVSQPGSGETGETFQLRGLIGNSYTKILVNNQPVKASVLQSMPIESQLPVRQAERIEVIYGPASAVYGADATAGVINIITRQPEHRIFSLADIALGSDGYNYVNFMAGGKAGRNKNILDYTFYGSKAEAPHLNIFEHKKAYHALSFLEQQGYEYDLGGTVYKPTQLTNDLLEQYSIPVASLTEPNYEGTIEMPDTSNIPAASQLIGLELKYRKFNFSYLNMARSTHSSIGLNSYLYKYNDPTNIFSDKTNRVSLGYDTRLGKTFSQTRLIVLNYETKPESNFGITYIPYMEKAYVYASSNEIYLDEMISFAFNKFEFSGGMGLLISGNLPQTNYAIEPFDKNKYSAFQSVSEIALEDREFGFNPYMFAQFHSFFQAFYKANRFSLMGSLRHDVTNLYGDKFSPRAGLIYLFANNKTSVRCTAGKAFRAPSGNTMYRSIAYPIGQGSDSMYYAVIPNPELRPEEFTSYEIGIRHTFYDKIYVDLSGFYNKVFNLISSSYVDPQDYGYPQSVHHSGDQTRINVNSEGAESLLYGVQFYGRYNDMFPGYNTQLEIGLTFAKGREELPEDGGELNLFRLMPGFQGKAKLSSQPFRRFYFMFLGTWAGKWSRSFMPSQDFYKFEKYQNIDGYFTLDLTASFLFNKNLSIFYKMTNVFNTDYGGLDATGYDIDLRYNPQLGRCSRFGMTFRLN